MTDKECLVSPPNMVEGTHVTKQFGKQKINQYME